MPEGPARPAHVRILLRLPERRQMRRHALRTPLLRLSGGNARIHRTGAGGRHRGQRRGVSAQRLGAAVPPRPDPGHVARTQHGRIHLLFVRSQRGPASLGAGAARGARMPTEHNGRIEPRNRQAQQTADRLEHRTAAQLQHTLTNGSSSRAARSTKTRCPDSNGC